MNLIPILKELSHRRALIIALVVGAALISVAAVYKVSVSPPSIGQRETVDGEGSIEILVDSARSPIADARRDLTGLTYRAAVFARLIAGGNIVDRMAKQAGIPSRQIDVVGPTPLPGEAPGVEPRQIHPYGISITAAEELPILTVVTRAPTAQEAAKLAAAAPPALSREVQKVQQQQGTPPERRVEFRLLGPVESGHVDAALGKKAALGLFLVLVTLGLFLILGIPRFRAAWRAVEPDALMVGDPNEEETTWHARDETSANPDVLRLPSDRGNPSSEEEDHGATILRRE